MQFRSPRNCLKPKRSVPVLSPNRLLSTFLSLATLTVCSFASSYAHAETRVEGGIPYDIVGTSPRILYLATPSLTSSPTPALDRVDTEAGYQKPTFATNSSSSTDYNEIIRFRVFDLDATYTGTPYITAYAATTSGVGANFVPVPIAQVNRANCDGNNCLPINGTGSNYFAVYTQGAEVEIGLNLDQICDEKNGNIAGCNGDDVDLDGSRTPFIFKFQIATYDAFNSLSDVSAGNATDPDRVEIRLQGTKPTLTCDSGTLENSYFPEDASIIVNPGAFSVDTALYTDRSPVGSIVVVGTLGGALTSTTSIDANPIKGRLPIHRGSQAVGGFVNTTSNDENDNAHFVQFAARDVAGALSDYDASCSIARVRTSEVQTFLNKSNCFIATAAFGSTEEAPVLMLRTFRDQVLLKKRWGKAFVRWYYNWSPSAAFWLMENPAFRFPVLTILVPVQAVSWLLLHPALFTSLLLLTIFSLLLFLIGVSRPEVSLSNKRPGT